MSDVLEERQTTHGDFHDTARIAQALKAALRSGPSWRGMSTAQHEAIEHICTKLARIAAGDPHAPDHWEDIAGYARLPAFIAT
jgi:hypothetical protein